MQAIESELLRLYRDPALTSIPALLEQRGGAYYSEAAAALLASLVTGDGGVHEVDVPNAGLLPGLADDDVVEVPARVDRSGPHPLPQPPLAPELLGLVQHVAAYERLAVRAALSGDSADVRKALLAHPLVGQWDVAAELARVCPMPWWRGDRGRRDGPATPAGGRRRQLQDRRAAPRRLGAGRRTGAGPELRADPPRAGRRDGHPRRPGAAGLHDGRSGRPGSARPAVGVFALAGADLPFEEEELLAACRRRDWVERAVVHNDAFALLRAGTDRGWGVAVVCGAGINAVGVGPDGAVVRFPALGAITGDWGGGYDVGFAALGAAVRAQDGRGAPTLLESAVPAYFGLPDPLAVSVALHTGELAEGRLVELPPLLFDAARQGDPVSRDVVVRLAGEVVAVAVAAVRRLALLDRHPDVVPDVVLGGGLLRAGLPLLDDAVRSGILQEAPAARSWSSTRSRSWARACSR